MMCRVQVGKTSKGRRVIQSILTLLLGIGLALAAVGPAHAAQSVTLAWNANTETNLAGYRLYYGTAARTYAATLPVSHPTTNATVNNLQEGVTYFFAVTAYTVDGLESDYSDEVSYLVPGSGTNAAPTLAAISNVTINEDAAAQTVNLTGIGSGSASENQTLVVTASSSNPGLIPNPTVSYTSPNATGSLSFTPVANANGTATITVTVNDGQAANNTVSRTFTVTVNAVNDVPTLAALSNVSLPLSAPAQTVSLSGIGSGAANESQTLVVTASSSNPGLIPNPTVTYTTPNATGSLGFTPVAGASGTATITVTVNDGQAVNNTVSRTFTVTVAGNQAPTLAAISNVTINEDAVAQTVNLTGIGSGSASENQTLVVTASSSNSGLIPNPTVSYTSPNATGSLSFTPVANANGTATITVTVNDGQAANNTVSRTFTVTVNAVNDVPTLAALSNVSLPLSAPAQTVSLSGIGSGAANESQTLVVTASSSNTGLIPNPTVTYTTPNATGSLGFTPVAGASGTATITVTVNDGQAVNNTVSRTFTVTVAGNQAPTLAAIGNVTINEDAAVQTVNLTGIGSGSASENQTLVVTASSSNTGLIPNPTVTYTSPNATGSLSFTPVADANGTATITVTVNDGQAANNTVSQTFTVTVNAVNDVPTLAGLSNVSLPLSAPAQTVSLSGIGSGAANESQTLVVTASSSNTGLIPNPTVTYTTPNATGSLGFTPVAGASGTATITVTVNDGQAVNNTVSRTFTVTVAGNQAPTLAAISNVTINEDAAAQTVNLTGIGSGSASENQTLVVTASSSNTGLIPNPTVTYTSPNATGSLSFTPVADANGTATITVTVNDGQAANNTVSQTFTVTVNAVNDVPTLAALSNVSLPLSAPAQTVSLSGIGSGAANESQNLVVTASSSNTGLVPNPTVTYTTPNATGSLGFTPVAGASGTATITVTVNDGQAVNNTVSRTFTVTVAGNQAPTLAAISNVTINEDAAAQTVNLTGIGSGSASENQTLVVTASSSNTGLIPNPTVTYTSPNATGSLSFTPVADANGTATITVTVNDGQAANNTVSQTFTVTVNAVNDVPTLAALSNVSLPLSAPAQTVSLSGIGSGAANESQTLVVTASSSNPGLVPNPTVTYTTPNATGSLGFTPVAGASGTATITVTVNDGQAVNNTVSRTFTVTVAGNQAPTLAAISNVTINEDASAQTVNLTGIGSGSASENQTLVVTATSSNPGLIPNPTVSYTSPNATGSLSVTPTANANGTATITVTVNDGQAVNNTVSQTFTVTVSPVNDAPTLAAVSDVVIKEDASMQTVNLSGIGSGAPNESQILVVTATSSNPGLVPDPIVTYTSPNTTAGLSFAPATNATGVATITVTVNDGQAVDNTVTRTFTVTVDAVNDAPTLASLDDLTVSEDASVQTVTLAGIGSGAANESQALVVTAASSNPGLIPNPTVTYASPNATGSLSFTPVANANGTATITVTVNDGQPANNTVSQTFQVTVTSVNDAPTLGAVSDVVISEDASTQTVNLTGIGAGAANESQALVVTASSSNPGLIPNPTVSYTSPNPTGALSFNPVANAYGTATITVTVNDGQAANNTVARTFVVTVNAINDPPTLAPLANVSLPPNAPAQTVNLTGIGTGAANENQTLVVTATSSNPGLIPNPTVSYISPNAAGTLGFTPVASASGTAIITVTVNDGQPANNAVSQTFTVTVTSGNQAPTLNPIADVVLNEDAQQYLVNFGGISAGGVGEVQTLTVTAASSNPGLIPTPTVRYDSPTSGGYLTFTPVPDAHGTALISVTVDDGQPVNNTMTRWFQVTVNPVNDAPTLALISDVEMLEDSGSYTVPLTGISTGAANEDQTLVITATSSNPGVIPDPSVNYTSPASTGSLTVTPVTNGMGSATITVTLSDGQAANSTVVRTFYLAVRGLNDAPMLSEIPDLFIPANGTSGPLPFTVEDPDSSMVDVRLRVVSSDAALLPSSGLLLAGTGTNRTLTITPAANASGSAQVTLEASDGYATNRQVIAVTVGILNQAPIVSSISNQVIDASTTLPDVPFQVSDAETPAGQLVVTATSYNKTVVPDSGIALGGTGGNRTISITPAPGKSGDVAIGLTVSDGSRQTQTSFQLTVVAVKSRLTLNKKGKGNVQPDLNGQALNVGEAYTIVAEPDAGQVFASWGGDVLATGTTLTFVMASNMVIEATFEPDPYLAAEGTYNGLLAEAEQVQHDQSGSFTLKSTSRGSYSGKVQVGRGKYPIKGLLSRNGKATNVVLRPGLSPLTIELSMGTGANVGRIGGRVTDGSWTAILEGDRQAYNTRTNPAPFAGTYTLILPPDESSVNGPQGYGYSTIKIDGNGVASFLGVLADGTKATQKVPLSKNGHWPFYVSLYKGAGSALGWLNLSQSEGQLDGLVSWIKPAMPSKYCAAGFTNETMASGATYAAPTPEDLKGGARRTAIACSGGNLAELVTGDLMVLPNGKLVTQGNGAIKFGVAPTTGLFKGTVVDPGTGKPRSFSGVMLQKWNVGAGLVLGLDEVGSVELAQ